MAFCMDSRFTRSLESHMPRISMGWRLVLFASSLLLTSSSAAQRSAERPPGDGVVRFNDVKELIANWRPTSHVYVLGDVGLSASELTELESWLDQNGPHWTVLLLETAANQTYVAPDGRAERGMDAVELALGKGLMDVSQFQQLVHPQTLEPDGAVFVLFLRERKFSYRASLAQERRGLGASRWLGELDRPAFQAMRGGGRVADAVRDTVSSISRRLDQRISHEIQSAIQQEEARSRALSALQARLASESDKLKQLIDQAGQLRAMLGPVPGDLVTRRFSDLQQQLSLLENDVQADSASPNELERRTYELAQTLDDLGNAYAEFQNYDASKQTLEDRLRRLSASGSEAASAGLRRARQSLENAQRLRDQGDSAFQRELNAAEQALEEADAAIRTAQAAQEQAAARARLMRRTAVITGGTLAVVLLGVLVWLNRKRQPVRVRALQQLETRQAEVRRELEGVMELIERGQTVIGDRDEVERKGYAGVTRDVSLAALRDVDNLLVMSNSVDRVLEQAAQLIRPGGLWGILVNAVSGSRLQQGFDLLDREPIRFGANEGVTLVLDDQKALQDPQQQTPAARDAEETTAEGSLAPQTKRRKTSVAASEGDPGEITLSYSELFRLFRAKSTRTAEAIQRVEDAWSRIVQTAAEVQTKIDQAQAAERQASDASAADGLFAVPSLFQSLLPSAQAEQDQGEDLGRTDPVQALEGPLAESARKAADALQLANTIVECRQAVLPGVERGEQALKQRQRDTEWIGQALEQLGAAANELAGQGVEKPIAQEIEAWQGRVEHLEAEVRRSLQLDDDAAKTVAPAIASSRSTVAQGRDEIAKTLRVDVKQTLAERQQAPDPLLDRADQDLAAAYSSLDRGDTEGALLALDSARRHVGVALDHVHRSLSALRELPGKLDAAEERLRFERRKIPEHQDLLSQLQREFAAAALHLQDLDAPSVGAPGVTPEPAAGSGPTQGETPPSANELVRRAAEFQELAERSLANARKSFEAAELLKAAGLHVQADSALESSQGSLQRLQQHADALRQTARHNEGAVEELQRKLGNLRHHAEDRRATRPLQEMIDETNQQLASLRSVLAPHKVAAILGTSFVLLKPWIRRSITPNNAGPRTRRRTRKPNDRSPRSRRTSHEPTPWLTSPSEIGCRTARPWCKRRNRSVAWRTLTSDCDRGWPSLTRTGIKSIERPINSRPKRAPPRPAWTTSCGKLRKWRPPWPEQATRCDPPNAGAVRSA